MTGTEKRQATGSRAAMKVWPVTNARCSARGCAEEDGYIVQAICTNCRDEVPFLITKGHRKPGYIGPECPNCGCREWTYA